MPGMMRSKNSWNWGAYGKHPVGKDYFRAGPEDPFLHAFSDWIENGFRKLNPEKNANPLICSWRFWARGYKKGSIACGVVRDSSDSIGRPYPLLIMGTGPLKGWENHWDLLPLAFEKTWVQIEHLATGRFVDFKQMEDEVRSIKPPGFDWKVLEHQREFPEEIEPSSNGRSRWDLPELEKRIISLREKPETFIPLRGGRPDDHFDFVSLLHFLVKKNHTGAVPNSIFMGGVPDNTYLAVFMRPLAPTDFVRLWSVCAEGG
jgi:type VI secretion system protein VasJ